MAAAIPEGEGPQPVLVAHALFTELEGEPEEWQYQVLEAHEPE